MSIVSVFMAAHNWLRVNHFDPSAVRVRFEFSNPVDAARARSCMLADAGLPWSEPDATVKTCCGIELEVSAPGPQRALPFPLDSHPAAG